MIFDQATTRAVAHKYLLCRGQIDLHIANALDGKLSHKSSHCRARTSDMAYTTRRPG